MKALSIFLTSIVLLAFVSCNSSNNANNTSDTIYTEQKVTEEIAPEGSGNNDNNESNSEAQNIDNSENQSSESNIYTCKWCNSSFTGIGWSFDEFGDNSSIRVFEGKHRDLLLSNYAESLVENQTGVEVKSSNIGDYCSKKCATEAAYNQ